MIGGRHRHRHLLPTIEDRLSRNAVAGTRSFHSPTPSNALSTFAVIPETHGRSDFCYSVTKSYDDDDDDDAISVSIAADAKPR